MAILRRTGWLWNIFARLFGLRDFYGGEITLSYGHQIIEIHLCHHPRQIWLSINEPCHSVPVCCGDINLVGAKITRRGFILDADIKTNSATVQWFIQY